MGNKNGRHLAAPTRAHSTTTPPSSASSAVTASSQQHAQNHHHHRISRRRSEFQQSRRPNSDNVVTGGTTMNTAHSTSNSSGTTNSTIMMTNNANNMLAPVSDRPPVPVINHPNGTAETAAAAATERTRQNRRRWSSIANVNPRSGSAQVVKPKRLTPRQCHLVIKAWSRRTQKSRVVRDIFAAIFTEAEELKTAFGIETASTGKRLRQDNNFVQHTNMFADTLDFVIRNLDDLSLVTENAEQLGRRHASFPLEYGFRPEYWNIFTECICECVCAGVDEDKETQIAWRQLVQTLVYYMKLGYDRETLRITRHSSFRRSNSPMARHQSQKHSTSSATADRPSSSSGLSSATLLLEEQQLLLQEERRLPQQQQQQQYISPSPNPAAAAAFTRRTTTTNSRILQ